MENVGVRFRERTWGSVPVSSVLLLLILVSALGAQDRAGEGSAAVEATDGQVAGQKRDVDSECVERSRPRTDEFAQARRDMVARQIEARGVRDAKVLEAMRQVPRHWFVPEELQAMAHADRPLPIGEGQTISQPYIVALMTEALKLTPESKVLEVGTGSGYQAAVLSEITPHVFTIEIVESLGRRAIDAFERHGYEDIKVRIGDGYAGWPDHAPFDAIIVTCAPDHVPSSLLQQLKQGGRMCIPVGSERGVQKLYILTKGKDDEVERQTLLPVRFVPMTGEAQER